MRRFKIYHLFSISYLLSFTLLVFHYLDFDKGLKASLTSMGKSVGFSNQNMTVLLIFLAVIFSALLYLIYHFLLSMVVKKIGAPVTEQLSAAILVSETACNVFVLSFLGMFPTMLFHIFVPILGILVLYLVLRERDSKRATAGAVLARTLLYLSNIIALVLGLI